MRGGGSARTGVDFAGGAGAAAGARHAGPNGRGPGGAERPARPCESLRRLHERHRRPLPAAGPSPAPALSPPNSSAMAQYALLDLVLRVS